MFSLVHDGMVLGNQTAASHIRILDSIFWGKTWPEDLFMRSEHAPNFTRLQRQTAPLYTSEFGPMGVKKQLEATKRFMYIPCSWPGTRPQ